MTYAAVPGLDRPVPRLVLGTMACSTDDMEKSRRLLDAFVAAGGNMVDTAHIYGGGKSERALGQWIAERDNRADVLILGKGAHHAGDGTPRVNPDAIRQDLSESLERVGTDYFDLYLLHRDDPTVPVGPIVEALHTEKEAGRVRAYGGSNWTAARLQEANDYAAAHGLTPFAASSPHLSLAAWNEPPWPGCLAADEAEREWYERTQFPLFAWSSQANGFFAGRFALDGDAPPHVRKTCFNATNWKRLDRARQLAPRRGVSPNALALAYVLNQPFPAFALIGPHTTEELDDSLTALGVQLSPDELRWLEGGDGGA